MNIYNSISSARSGSDIHGVLEKIAYRLHLRDNRNMAGANWNSAKEAFRHWEEKRPLLSDRRTPEQDLKELLDFRAYSYTNRGGTAFDNWMSAQNNLAEEIFKDYLRKLEGLNRRFDKQYQRAAEKAAA